MWFFDFAITSSKLLQQSDENLQSTELTLKTQQMQENSVVEIRCGRVLYFSLFFVLSKKGRAYGPRSGCIYGSIRFQFVHLCLQYHSCKLCNENIVHQPGTGWGTPEWQTSILPSRSHTECAPKMYPSRKAIFCSPDFSSPAALWQPTTRGYS